MPDSVTVCFYRGGAWNLFDLLVRWATRRKGQAWADVPCHCALIIPTPFGRRGWLYEMISAGFHQRPGMIDDFENVYQVEVSDMGALKTFLSSQAGCRYGWLTILEIALCRICPQKWFKSTRGQKQQDCSWLVKAALEAGGWDCPHWLRRQYEPPSPNDLLFAVQQTQTSRKTK
jgi:hypothetical protein